MLDPLAHQVRVDVVEDEQPRQVTGRLVVVVRAAERREEGDVAEGRAADPEHHDVVEAALDRGRVGLDALEHVLGVGQVEPAQVLAPAGQDGLEAARRGLGQGLELGVGEPVLGADGVGHDVGVVESDRVHRAARGWAVGRQCSGPEARKPAPGGPSRGPGGAHRPCPANSTPSPLRKGYA